jgi:hypothetical protein
MISYGGLIINKVCLISSAFFRLSIVSCKKFEHIHAYMNEGGKVEYSQTLPAPNQLTTYVINILWLGRNVSRRSKSIHWGIQLLLIYKLRNKLPSVTLQTIYYAFVHPNIRYGIQIYANTHFTYLEKLIRLNNKIFRILQFKSLSTPIAELYLTYNTLPIVELHKMQLLTPSHKYSFHRSTLPEAYSEYFIAYANMHDYNTRCKDDIHLNSCRLSYGRRCIKSKSASLWNALPAELKK